MQDVTCSHDSCFGHTVVPTSVDSTTLERVVLPCTSLIKVFETSHMELGIIVPPRAPLEYL